MSELEQQLLESAVKYVKGSNRSMAKMAWALSSVMEIPDNTVLHQMREIGDQIDDEELTDIQDKEEQSDILDEVEEEEEFNDKIGEIVHVECVSVRTYGAVCKVKGTTRTLLLHISEIADEFIDDISKYVEPGDEFPAMLMVNPKGEVALSTRRFQPLNQKEKSSDDVSEYPNVTGPFSSRTGLI